MAKQQLSADSLEIRRAKDLYRSYVEWYELRDAAIEEAQESQSLERRHKLLLHASLCEANANKAWEQIDSLKRKILKDFRVPDYKLHYGRQAVAMLTCGDTISDIADLIKPVKGGLKQGFK